MYAGDPIPPTNAQPGANSQGEHHHKGNSDLYCEECRFTGKTRSDMKSVLVSEAYFRKLLTGLGNTTLDMRGNTDVVSPDALARRRDLPPAMTLTDI
jgi:hypothetical protein